MVVYILRGDTQASITAVARRFDHRVLPDGVESDAFIRTRHIILRFMYAIEMRILGYA